MGCSTSKDSRRKKELASRAETVAQRSGSTEQHPHGQIFTKQPDYKHASLNNLSRHANFSEPKQAKADAAKSKYKLTKEIEKGVTSRIFEAYDRTTNKRVVIKFLKRGYGCLRSCTKTRAEIINHMKLTHPHIIEAKEVYVTPEFLALVLEHAPGGDLFEYVDARGRLDDATARRIFQQLVIALEYCHAQQVVHRDLKPENTLIMTQDGRPFVKLCDFGYSKEAFEARVHTQVGTVGYTAPEILIGRSAYTGACDVWSLGCLLYVMVIGDYPFLCESENEECRARDTAKRVVKADYKFPDDVKISEGAADLIRQMLVVDPGQRITIAGITQHPWFRKRLPKAALTLNEECLKIPSFRNQSQTEIECILAEAGHRGVPRDDSANSGSQALPPQ